MSRVITAISIITAIIAYSVFAIFVIRSETSELISSADEVRMYNNSGDTANAADAAERLSDKWLGFEKKMSVFVRDDKLTELSKAISKVRPYVTAANDELNAELENISRQLWLLYRSELPAWYNIL